METKKARGRGNFSDFRSATCTEGESPSTSPERRSVTRFFVRKGSGKDSGGRGWCGDVVEWVSIGVFIDKVPPVSYYGPLLNCSLEGSGPPVKKRLIQLT